MEGQEGVGGSGWFRGNKKGCLVRTTIAFGSDKASENMCSRSFVGFCRLSA